MDVLGCIGVPTAAVVRVDEPDLVLGCRYRWRDSQSTLRPRREAEQVLVDS